MKFARQPTGLVRRADCSATQVFYGRPEAAEAGGLFGNLRGVLSKLNRACIKNPNRAAAFSSGVVFFSADCTAQYFSYKRDGTEWDFNRCLALTSFGCIYYGGICVRLYRVYDRVFGRKTFFMKALFDCCVHSPFGVIPSFYLWTHMFERRQDSLIERLQNDWWAASTASTAYWFPVQMTCFSLIPSVHRVAYVSFASFVHKSVLSWWAHRCPGAEDELLREASEPITVPPKLPTKKIDEFQGKAAVSNLVPALLVVEKDEELQKAEAFHRDQVKAIHETQAAGTPIVEEGTQIPFVDAGRKPSLGERLMAQHRAPPTSLLGGFGYFP